MVKLIKNHPKGLFSKIIPNTEGGSLFGVQFRGLAYRIALLRDVATRKLPYFLEFWNETWWEWSLGINAGTIYALVPFRQQGAELFSSKGGKICVSSIFSFFFT